MKVILCQTDIAWENKAANYEKARQLLGTTTVPADAMIVLPEMFATGFSMDVPAIHESQGGPSEQFLAGLAVEHKSCVVGGVVNLGPDGRGRNQSVAFGPTGTLLARYSKIQPFSLGGETRCYSPGTEVVTFVWQGFQVSPFVCYDLRFPELFRAAVRKGAQVLVVIANWPVKRIGHWVTLLQARAIENQAYVVGVNRSGTDPGFTYTGRSLVVDPHGNIIADAGEREGVVTVALDLETVINWRRDFPALQDIHPEWLAP